MTLEHFQRAWTQLNDSIFARLRSIFVALHHARLAHLDLALTQIAVIDEQGDLLGRPQPSEESELVVIALSLAPIAMDGGDERFGFLDREWVRRSTILLRQSEALQGRGRIVLLGVISIAEFERAADDAHNVVVSLLVDANFSIDDLGQPGILHVLEDCLADRWSPGRCENLSIALERCERKIVFRHPRLAVSHEIIEDHVAGPQWDGRGSPFQEFIIGKLISEGELPASNSLLDLLQLLPRATQVRF